MPFRTQKQQNSDFLCILAIRGQKSVMDVTVKRHGFFMLRKVSQIILEILPVSLRYHVVLKGEYLSFTLMYHS